MASRFADTVVFITGAARGQGRSHALRFAQEGADIIALDFAGGLPTVNEYYPPATDDDLQETVEQVKSLGRRIVAGNADVRDYGAVERLVRQGVSELGPIDSVVANAGIFISGSPAQDISEDQWDDVMDVNLKGAWHTCKAVIPSMVERGAGGSITLISSTAGLKGSENTAAYAASKHAVVGLMRTLSNELGRHSIRVNTVHPGATRTQMILNDRCFSLFQQDGSEMTEDTVVPYFTAANSLPVPWVEPDDISNSVLFLASDQARFITGTELKVDAGFTTK